MGGEGRGGTQCQIKIDQQTVALASSDSGNADAPIEGGLIWILLKSISASNTGWLRMLQPSATDDFTYHCGETIWRAISASGRKSIPYQ